MRSMKGSFAIAAALVACGGEAASSKRNSEGGGGSSDAAVGDAGGARVDASDGKGGSGFAGSGGGSEAGPAGFGGSTCVPTEDHAKIDVAGPPSSADAGEILSADAGAILGPPSTGRDVRFRGRVTSTAPDRIELDTCVPRDPSCAGQPPASVQVAARGLDLTVAIVPGALAEVHYQLICPFSCSEAVVVTGLSTIGSVQNPFYTPLYFAAAEGTVSPPSGAPFAVTTEQLKCTFWREGTNGSGHAYSLAFGDPAFTQVVTVGMGRSTLFYLQPGNQELMVWNLRSYEVGIPDSLPDVAWWVSSFIGQTGGVG